MEKYQSLLQQTLEIAKEKYNSRDFNDLFNTVPTVYKVENDHICFITSDALSKYRINKFYIEDLNEIVSTLISTPMRFKIVTTEDYNKEMAENKYKFVEPAPKQKQNSVYFRHEYTFENFMVGESNRFAFVSAMKVAENPHVTYNPLYIFGDVGLGKTHLMTAIGQYLLDNNVNTNIVYVNANLFAEEYFLATRTNSGQSDITSFYDKYRNADILLVDDVQFLNNKTKTQEEFFKIFEYLHTNNKQIILTSDCAANDLQMMARLKSRFNWGLCVDIKAPDKNLRINILKNKLSFLIKNVNEVPLEALELIAEYFPDNIRELEGALRRYINYCVTLDMSFTIENVSLALDSILPKNKKLKEDNNAESEAINLVKKSVVEYFHGINVAELEGSSRKQTITYPRQLAMYILKTVYNIQLNRIGDTFGRRDHATVGHGIDKIESLIKTNSLVKKDLELLLEKCKKN